MTWDEACLEIGRSLDRLETRIDLFIAKHGAVLDAEILDGLNQISGKAAVQRLTVYIDLLINKTNDY